MKKTFLSFFVGFLMLSALGAQGLSQNSPQSLSIEIVCSVLATNPNTTGDFVQTKTISKTGRKLKSSGKFIISNLGIMWQTQKPFPSSLIMTKDSMIQIAADGSRSVMSGKDNQIFENISQTLSSVFAGNVSDLNKNFSLAFSAKDGGAWEARLTPKDSTIAAVMNELILSGSTAGAGEAGVGSKTLGVAAGGGASDGAGGATGAATDNLAVTLESLEMLEASGNNIKYEFLNQKYPKELSADEKSVFSLD